MQGQLDAGALVADRYEVRRLLGAGGMGAVYEAVHTMTLRTGALKVLHAEFAAMPDVVTRFLREASAAGRIGSRHIVETFDAGRCATGEPYIFMELLDGRSLEDELQANGRLRLGYASTLIRQACRGLSAAHAAGIVHRDIKPENLFLVNAEPPLVKILDFGISKFDPSLTAARPFTLEGSTLGTPFYMSPEQVLHARDVDARTDVYSLAVSLYRLITGTYPFIADTLPAISVLIHQGNYSRVSTLCPEVSAAFDDVLARAMAVDRNRRFATAAEFERALAPFAGADTPVAQSSLENARTALSSADPSTSARATEPSAAAATAAPVSQTLAQPPLKRPPWLALAGAAFVLGVLLLLVLRQTPAPSPTDPASLKPETTLEAARPAVDPPKSSLISPQVTPTLVEPAPSQAPGPPLPPTSASSTTRGKHERVPPEDPGKKAKLKQGRLGAEFTREFE